MSPGPRHIETAGRWRETSEGLLYAAVAKSGDEVLAKADFTLAVAEGERETEAKEVLAEMTRQSIEDEIEEVVRQQAVRVLDRREEEVG